MTVKEVHTLCNNLLDVYNAYNVSRKIIIKNESAEKVESAENALEVNEIKMDFTESLLSQCNIFIRPHFDKRGLIFKVTIKYHDTAKEIKCESNFRFIDKLQ